MNTLTNIFEYELLNIGDYKIRAYTLILVILIPILTKLLLFAIKKVLFRIYKTENQDIGNTYALYQIIEYIIWVVAIGLIFETIGIKLTLLLAGSAALLVGIGLGLQQTFNDIVSGIILLTERSIKVGDILEIDHDIVKIEKIGLRTSNCSNRDEISIIIPNSLITTNKVINWSHQTQQTRFKIDIGVAYGSEINLVIKILIESAKEHPAVSKLRNIEARLNDFGNSSIDMQLLFYSTDIFRIEKIKSDIRQTINQKFAQNNITIPFPQMDLHLKSNFKTHE
jgi:small-conductance mechanosensitive channel